MQMIYNQGRQRHLLRQNCARRKLSFRLPAPILGWLFVLVFGEALQPTTPRVIEPWRQLQTHAY